VEGILMHEMAHAILMQMGDHEHSEREADETAEEVFGKRISYDREDVQTTGTGIHPRPLHLEQ
jgi:predicted SprT family Zn-dependent metalloprotease